MANTTDCGPFETYLQVEDCRSGDTWSLEIGPDEPLDIEALICRWADSEFCGELTLDGEIMPQLQGDYYAAIITDWRPTDSCVVWEGGGFYLREAD